MAKIKPVLPTLRERKRYIVYEILSEDKISDFEPIKNSIDNSFLSLFGTSGMADAGIMHLKDKYDKNTQSGIIKVSHKNVGKLRSALALIKEIEKNKVIVRSLRCSGILKKVKR